MTESCSLGAPLLLHKSCSTRLVSKAKIWGVMIGKLGDRVRNPDDVESMSERVILYFESHNNIGLQVFVSYLVCSQSRSSFFPIEGAVQCL